MNEHKTSDTDKTTGQKIPVTDPPTTVVTSDPKHDTTTVQNLNSPADQSPVKTHLEDPPPGYHYQKSVAEHNAEVDQLSAEKNKYYKK